MAKFRKRPLEIAAEQYFNEPLGWPEGVCTCEPNGKIISPHVHTAHQGQVVELESGDWIVPEGDGKHFYPIKDEIFRATYEPLEASTAELPHFRSRCCDAPVTLDSESLKDGTALCQACDTVCFFSAAAPSTLTTAEAEQKARGIAKTIKRDWYAWGRGEIQEGDLDGERFMRHSAHSNPDSVLEEIIVEHVSAALRSASEIEKV